MSESDSDYYCRRLAEETAAAQQASCPVIKGIHLELAGRYSDRLATLRTSPARLAYPRAASLDRGGASAPPPDQSRIRTAI